MECNTQNQVTYKGHIANPPQKNRAKLDDQHKPILGLSSYAKSFPNWKNG